MDKAYSLLTIKSINEDRRIIEGIASTPSLDRSSDRVNPLGVKFTLPMPFLWQHNPRQPIGMVEYAKASEAGIKFRARIPFIKEPGPTKDRVDGAWQDLKAGLVMGASIGYRIAKGGAVKNQFGGYDINEWEWLELSAVTIPDNREATILSVKSICGNGLAASGDNNPAIEVITGVSVSRKPHINGNLMNPKISERIKALEALRGQKSARITEVSELALGANRTMTDDERKECGTLKGEIDAIDGDLDIFRFQEKAVVATASPVALSFPVAGYHAMASVPAQPKEAQPAPGIRLSRLVRCKALARMEQADVTRIAEREYGTRDSWLVNFIKAGEVAPVSTSDKGDGLIPAELGLGDFAEWLRPMTILGKFGVNGVPALRRVPFRSGLASMAAGSAGYWVGEGKPKAVTLIDTGRTHLLPLKVAALIIATMELIRDSSPAAEGVIRQDMTEAIVATLDATFIDPTIAASAGVSPASITHDQDPIASTGTDLDAVTVDLRALFAKYEDADNPASQAVLVMSTRNARALGFMRTDLGTFAFPGMTALGGNVLGTPVIASDHAGTTVALISASDVYIADEGGVSVDMSTEASVEMRDSTHLSQNPMAPGTGASLVSLWQNNLIGFRAERTMNWLARRPVCAPYLTAVAWGGAVPAS